MTFKKASLVAYGAVALMTASSVAMPTQAASLSKVLPAAGIGLVLSDGTALSKIKETKVNTNTVKVSELVKMVEKNQSVVSKSTLVASTVMKDILPATEEKELQTYAGKQETKNQVLPETKNQVLPETKEKDESQSLSTEIPEKQVTVDSVIGMVASADESKLFTDAYPLPLLKDMETGEVAGAERPLEVDSEQKVADETISLIESVFSDRGEEEAESEETEETEEKVIETTQTAQEVAAVIEESLKQQLAEEEKEFSKLVIAKVDNYVNVRSLPDETSEVVGKLYDKSVGTYVSEQDGWYEINSGSVTGFVKAEFCVTGQDAVALAREVGIRIATITADALRVREDASLEARVLGRVPQGDELIVVEEGDEWIKVSIEEGEGWISKEFVELRTDFVKAESKEEEKARLAKEEAARKAAQAAAAAKSQSSTPKSSEYKPASTYVQPGEGSASGNAVAQFALQFVGNPYVYGGTSLTNGADCSGFVMSVYNNFGVSLPHSSSADRSVGSTVGSLGEAQPGDIVCYSGHVGIYIGGGQIVHASTSRTGIIVSNAGYRKILSIRRIF